LLKISFAGALLWRIVRRIKKIRIKKRIKIKAKNKKRAQRTKQL
jgi:hypothetical protein